MKKIVIIAGDLSADLYGGLLSRRIQEKFKNVKIYSFGGKNLAKYSEQILPLINYSVSGLFEVVDSIYKLYRIFNYTLNFINQIKPDLIIPIDFPDFNLRLIKRLNKKFPVFYYISPQIWAWRSSRIELIKKYVDTMVVIFKFEEEYYKKYNVKVKYFGHPLLELVKKQNVPTKKIISFMPGSRKNELKLHLPIVQKTKILLQKKLPDYSFRIIRPENINLNFYQKFSDIAVVEHSHSIIEESSFIIASSGTTTVEISLLEVPFLIFYRLNRLSWFLAKRLVKTEFIGMVNILARKKIVEEFLQDNATAEKLATYTLQILNNKAELEKIKFELSKLKETLSPYGATEKFASFIGEYLNLEGKL